MAQSWGVRQLVIGVEADKAKRRRMGKKRRKPDENDLQRISD
jgi:hypothetical protein